MGTTYAKKGVSIGHAQKEKQTFFGEITKPDLKLSKTFYFIKYNVLTKLWIFSYPIYFPSLCNVVFFLSFFFTKTVILKQLVLQTKKKNSTDLSSFVFGNTFSSLGVTSIFMCPDISALAQNDFYDLVPTLVHCFIIK